MLNFKMGQSLIGNYYSGEVEWLMDYVGSLLLGVLFFVIIMMIYLIVDFSIIKLSSKNFVKGEFYCGMIPAFILLIQMVPSFMILYHYGVVSSPKESLVVKIMGQQWFWSYDYTGYGDWLKFDAYLSGVGDLILGGERLLETDERLVIPVGVNVLFSIYSHDVIHSWSLPALGIKVDAMPGIFNNYSCVFYNVGVFYGMCSEFCGVGHSFMPIVVEVVPANIFSAWAEDRKHMFDIATRLGDWYAMHGVSSFV